jgi:hypothetical protein
MAEDRLVAWLRRTAEAADNTGKEKNKTTHVPVFADRLGDTGLKGMA